MKWDVLGADEVQNLCKNMGPRSSGKNHSKEDIVCITSDCDTRHMSYMVKSVGLDVVVLSRVRL
jgi:hypothetical protein